MISCSHVSIQSWKSWELHWFVNLVIQWHHWDKWNQWSSKGMPVKQMRDLHRGSGCGLISWAHPSFPPRSDQTARIHIYIYIYIYIWPPNSNPANLVIYGVFIKKTTFRHINLHPKQYILVDTIFNRRYHFGLPRKCLWKSKEHANCLAPAPSMNIMKPIKLHQRGRNLW